MSARTGPTIEAWLAPRRSSAARGAPRGGAAGRGNAARARPTLSPAAIRIPERVSAQLALVFPTTSPQLFIHEGARQALERRLKASSPGRLVILSITDNRQ